MRGSVEIVKCSPLYCISRPDIEPYPLDKYKPKIIFTSTATVYDIKNKLPVKENAYINPSTVYDYHKLLAEKYLESDLVYYKETQIKKSHFEKCTMYCSKLKYKLLQLYLF